MKLLFITTYNIRVQQEHFFTLEVIKGLIESSTDMTILSVVHDKETDTPAVACEHYMHTPYFILRLPFVFQTEKIIAEIQKIFTLLKPDVVHSNMIEGYEWEAADHLHIPVVYTIHIGGFICPRGGGNGLLFYNDEICPLKVGHQNCLRCCCSDLPGKDFLYYFLRLFSVRQRLVAYRWAQKRPFILFLTPVLLVTGIIEECLKKIEKFKQAAALISANERLQTILTRNGMTDNVVVIPHGVREREKLPLSALNGKIKFYYLGRIQYAKGLHVLLNALKTIPSDKYELHIIGDAEQRRREQRYYRRLLKQAENLPVIFHGRLPNHAIDGLINDYHVMIHPAMVLEVFGIAIAESLSMGRAVLATRCGGPEMQIIPQKNGWLVEPNNIVELQTAIEHIIAYPDEIAAFSRNAAISPFSHYINSLHQLYESF